MIVNGVKPFTAVPIAGCVSSHSLCDRVQRRGKTGRVYRARYPAEHDDPKLMPQEPDYFQEILSIDDLSKPRRAQSAEHNKYSDVLENAGDIGIGD